jgi:cyclic beta-1,2-glucan synthetase
VIAADIYGVAPHVGRVGWTWYTGSAGWFYRVLLENLLGLELSGGNELLLRPCIPDEWPGFTLHFTPAAGGHYQVRVHRSAAGATRATLDGSSITIRDGAVRIPLLGGGEHLVEVALAADVGPFYRCHWRG